LSSRISNNIIIIINISSGIGSSNICISIICSSTSSSISSSICVDSTQKSNIISIRICNSSNSSFCSFLKNFNMHVFLGTSVRIFRHTALPSGCESSATASKFSVWVTWRV
jgi:hypothetical protein